MTRRSKRTSAPAPSSQPASTPSTPVDQRPVLPPAMFGPATWCPPYAPQAMAAPSSAPWLAGQGMASSSAQGPWWPPTGISASTNHAPATQNLEDSDLQAWGVDSHPPGGFVNFLKKNTSNPAQVVNTGSSLQPINMSERMLPFTLT